MAMPHYHAGMLRHSITIKSRGTLASDSGGGGTYPWDVTKATARAYIKPLSGREQLHAMQLESPVTHKIVMRYVSGITADMRVELGSRYFNIRAVINVEERNRWLEIMAEEGVAQ